MSETKDGGPAFPSTFPLYAVDTATGDVREVPEPRGMSLRDYFAAAALTGAIAGEANDCLPEHREIGVDAALEKDANRRAAWCYAQADAMLKAREAPHG